MRYELIARIYPKSVVEKLETKRRQFEEDIAEIRKQTKRAECELRQYENIGQEFHTLVNDYQEILSQITQANRDIQMLQQ